MKFWAGRRFFVLGGLLVTIIHFNFAQLSAAPDWTILIYVQATNNLSKYAVKNFEELSLVGSNDKINILVQWFVILMDLCDFHHQKSIP